MWDELSRGAGLGVTGAATVTLVESVVTRLPFLNASPLGRALARFVLTGLLTAAARSAGAPVWVGQGMVASVVLVTTLDAGTSLVGRRRLDPPPPAGLAALGAPWPPRPAWALGAPGWRRTP